MTMFMGAGVSDPGKRVLIIPKMLEKCQLCYVVDRPSSGRYAGADANASPFRVWGYTPTRPNLDNPHRLTLHSQRPAWQTQSSS